ncbi:Coiled-coil domain-containing protein 22, putative isoform 2 [Hibiscus syriacus]|uniref:Coiled-coil domain-containing protein 22, putative isoform 2 n=1 Tax=Hibiscus syriacus TaxID=106335 RepID=A0A6A2ZPQ5_HIBSY|nr:Coiled-coil domain-containing protein 22, putative isoform 2 [Hibiscus syriacus]
MADKYKICSDTSLAFKNLGYVGDMSYRNLLYPSEEDLYKLNLDKEEVDQNLQKVEAILQDLRVDELSESSEIKTSDVAVIHDPLRVHDIAQNELFSDSNAEVVKSSGASGNEEIADHKDDEHIRYEAENLLSQEKVLKEELKATTLQMQHLEEELGLWKVAADMAFDESNPMDFFLEQLNKQIDVKKHNILELESQWDAFRKPIEDKKRNLEECLYANNPEALEKLQKLREIELEMQFTSSEIRKREEECLKLAAGLKKQPKVASRRSYIERIKEITKNSGKLDSGTDRILRETRVLQLESNSIQESLHRTYAVLDEIVFREAKKDAGRRQVYKLLTSIHDSFEQISEKIFATDRIRRETTYLEKKLAAMSSRSLNADKLQADLDNIAKENKYLEQQLQRD